MTSTAKQGFAAGNGLLVPIPSAGLHPLICLQPSPSPSAADDLHLPASRHVLRPCFLRFEDEAQCSSPCCTSGNELDTVLCFACMNPALVFSPGRTPRRTPPAPSLTPSTCRTESPSSVVPAASPLSSSAQGEELLSKSSNSDPSAGGQPWEHNCNSDRHGFPVSKPHQVHRRRAKSVFSR
ncbi:uncharacterized protein LOC119271531 [Triticum dicoccoides]|uniref:uncharacterized protein LOC119271531 n=1 Tax=Triticum dicoccoides TaxID=85692 RepID=UPI0018909563|nr:uncharacterized protein LOC119271531 [Triticum dicoccoides]